MKKHLLFFIIFLTICKSLTALTNWTGNSDTNWFNPANWDNGLPSIGNNAIIPAAPIGGLFPIINTPVVQNYEIDNSGIIEIAAGGSISNSSTFINRLTGFLDISHASGSFTNNIGSTFDNYGSAVWEGSFSNNGGNLINYTNGLLINLNIFNNDGNGTFTNNNIYFSLGTSSNNSTIDNLGSYEDLGLTINNQIINNQGTGVYMVTGTAELINNGTFNNNDSGNIIVSGKVNNLNTFNNRNNALITINNSGIVNNSNNFFNIDVATISNSGLINNFFCATLINQNNISNFSTINNEGIIWDYGLIFFPPININNGTLVTPANASGFCTNITRNINVNGNPITVIAADLVNPMLPFCAANYNFNIGGANSTTFNCNNIGNNTVSLTINGPGGFSTNCNAQVTIQDNIAPTANCVASFDLFLSNLGQAQLFTFLIDNGSNDNCDPSLNYTLDQQFFNCSHVGIPQTVTLTVTDDGNNSSQCMSTVNVMDLIPPVIPCQNITIQLDANGLASITAADLLVGTGFDDVCGVASLNLDKTDFSCLNIGANQVTLTGTDINGNSNNCMAFVNVQDNIPPVANCQNINAFLGPNGTVSITPFQIDNGSTDNCFIANLSLNGNTVFDCSHIGGTNMVTLNVSDNSGNTAMCSATVSIFDNLAPNMICQNIDLPLDANGQATLIANQIDGGSTDNCTIASLMVSQTSFSCSNLGFNTVSLTGFDPSGNTASCFATVNVVDNIPPTAFCRPPVNTITSPGICGRENIILLPPIVLAENCEISSIFNNAPTFYPLGTTVVTWSITDIGGNTTTCTQNVTINDYTPPTIECGNSFIAYATATQCSYPSYLLQGPEVDDNCGIASITSDAPAIFTPGDYMVNWTATDNNGNQSTCMQWVKVFDLLPPTLTFCPEDVVVTATQTNGSAQAYFPEAAAYDNCGPIAFSTSTHDSGDFFPLGETEVIQTLYDGYGNPANCEFTVTVEPIMPTQNLTVDCMPTLEVSIDQETDINSITWNTPLTESNCNNCDIILLEEVRHLGYLNGMNYYAFIDEKVSFSQAIFLSNAYGGRLVQIEDEKINLLLQHAINVEGAYIGLVDNNGDGNLTWANGTEFSSMEWQEGTIDLLDFPSAAVLNQDGTWTLQSLNEDAYFIFEVPCLNLDMMVGDIDQNPVQIVSPETTILVDYQATDECENEDDCGFEILFTTDIVPYCESIGVHDGTDNHRFIEKFAISTFQNTSGNNEGYGDYTNEEIELMPGAPIALSAQFGPILSNSPVFYRIWIDLNGDGDFYDENEKLIEGIDQGSFLNEISVPFPTNDDLEETQLRVAAAKNTFPEPCGNLLNGEVEDYTVKFNTETQGLISVDLAGLQEGTSTQLQWLTKTNRPIDSYLVERRTEEGNFEAIGSKGDQTQLFKSRSYGFKDSQPESGDNEYRLLVTLANGETFHSNSVVINFGMDPNEVILMPNPADENIKLSMKKLAGKSAQIKVFNSLGHAVIQKFVQQINDSPTNIDLNDLPDGLYQMQIIVNNQRPITKSFVVGHLNGYRPNILH